MESDSGDPVLNVRCGRHVARKLRKKNLERIKTTLEDEVTSQLKDKSFGSTGMHPIYILSKGEWSCIKPNSITLKYNQETD